MDKVIHKLIIAYRSAAPFMVPEDAEIVYIDRDAREPLHAAIWYTTKHVSEEDQDTIVLKRWDLAAIFTGEPFNYLSQYLGTVVDNGYVHHIIRTNAVSGQRPQY